MNVTRKLALYFGLAVLLVAVVLYGLFVYKFGYSTLVRHFGKPHGRLVPDLNVCLNDEDVYVSDAAVRRLAELGERGKEALPVIEEHVLSDELNPVVVSHVCHYQDG